MKGRKGRVRRVRKGSRLQDVRRRPRPKARAARTVWCQHTAWAPCNDCDLPVEPLPIAASPPVLVLSICTMRPLTPGHLQPHRSFLMALTTSDVNGSTSRSSDQASRAELPGKAFRKTWGSVGTEAGNVEALLGRHPKGRARKP